MKTGYDLNNQLIAFPKENGCSDTIGLCDYYFQYTGTCLVLRGGYSYSSSKAGCFSFNCSAPFSYYDGNIGCCLLKQVDCQTSI